ncbi:MAG: C4-dicarboxylate TRAP transporter substrate-binding protein [Notoacmeibacter sp.]|nr:C4-dicarboxylate TRAP transporter substrate-binding protein [Notoacmeibacter sp.]MCC0032719.1 C4-dicarboxylate TRAP transporter substrate-binding protein [Brucellaceae bacterium]
MTKTVLKSMLAGAALAVLAASAHAETIRATSAFGPSHVQATKVYPRLFEKLKEFTDGRWDGQDTPSGLVAPNEMNAGLRDGVTEMGPVILPYFAADYPESILVGELSVIGRDNRAIAGAVTEYIVNCAECQAEFKKFGQVYMGADTTTLYAFLSTKPIRKLDDMKGLRIRTAGAVFTRIVEALGGTPAQMPANELFEGLSQGVIDATYSSIPDLKNARLYDVVKYVTEINQGVFNAAATNNVSRMLWDRMSAEDRAALVHAAQYGQATGIAGWRETEVEARAEGAKKSIEFITPDASLTDAANAFTAEHLKTVAETLEKRGVKDAAAKVAKYTALVEKWEGLVKDLKTTDDYAELRYQEIWSKVDFATYGQ